MNGSDTLDHDPAAEDVTVRDLISAVHCGSVGSRGSRAQAAVELTGEPIPAAAWLGNSPDLAKTGVPGVKSARTRVRRALRSMCNPPEATERWIGAWSELATAGGCLLYTSPSPRDGLLSRMPSSA